MNDKNIELENVPSEKLESMAEEAFKKADTEDEYKEVIAMLDEMIKRFPRYDLNYYMRGYSYRAICNFAKAIEDFTNAIYYGCDDSGYFCDRGYTYLCLEKNEEALEDFAVAAELNPKVSTNFNNHGIALHNLHRYKEAIASYNKAIELEPNESLYYCNRANSLAEIDDLNGAMTDYDKAIELDPKEPRNYHCMALKFAQKGLMEKAESYLMKSFSLGNKSNVYNSEGEYYDAVGDVMMALRKSAAALDYYNLAINLEPDEAFYYKDRAVAYNALGKDKEAEADNEMARRLKEKNGAKEEDVTEACKKINPTAAKIIEILKEKATKKTVKMKFTKQKTTLTGSKLGGVPFVPVDGKYPVDKINGDKLYLLLQINFEEMPLLPDYPEKGILQIFIAADDQFGCDFDNAQDSWRVLYYEDTSKPMPIKKILKLMPHSKSKHLSLPFKQKEDEYKIIFQNSESLITPDDFRFDKIFRDYCSPMLPDRYKNKKYDRLPDKIVDDLEDVLCEGGSQVGGYPTFCQFDPRENSVPDNYELFIQLSSDVDNNKKFAMMWGDCGTASFFIDREDLKKKDFSKIFYTWDCC